MSKSKLDAIKEFIKMSAKLNSEMAKIPKIHYSSANCDEMIERLQELKRHARRIGVIGVDTPLLEDAEYKVLLRFDEFCSFINLEECTEKMYMNKGETNYHYSIVIDNIALQTIKLATDEEHKKAQAI